MKNREQFIVDNLGLVNKVIGLKYKYVPYEYDDIFSEGVIGLIRAVDNYDESKGAFSTFAFKCINMEIIKYLENRQHKMHAYSLDTNEFTNKKEIENINLMSVIGDDNVNIEEDYFYKEEKEIINKLLCKAKLTDRNRFIILLHYGFYNGRVYSRSKLAEIFNMTEQNISLIIKKFLIQMDKLIIKEYDKDVLYNRDKYKLYSRLRKW